MSLSKTFYPLLSTGSTQENPSWHDWKNVDWDVKDQNKQKKLSRGFKDCHEILVLNCICRELFLDLQTGWTQIKPLWCLEKQTKFNPWLTLYLLMLSADNFCKQFCPRSGLTKCSALTGSKIFGIDGIPRRILKKIHFEKKNKKNQPADEKWHKK